MCVDTQNYTCCCCSLTTATYILGVLRLIATIAYAGQDYWASFACQLIITIMFIMVFINPNDARTRKILFYGVSVCQAISICVSIILFLVLLFTDNWINDACRWNLGDDNLVTADELRSYQNCKEYAKSGLIVGFIWVFSVQLLLMFMVWQVLYYGWKEQEEKFKDDHYGQKTSIVEGTPVV